MFTREQVLSACRSAHGDKFEYDIPDSIKDSRERIRVVCKTHGEFLQEYRVHVYQRCGCPFCISTGKLPLSIRTQRFFDKARDLYGDRFDYTYSEYVNNDTPISVICTECHNMFSITPSQHLRRGGGCPTCNLSGGEAAIYRWLMKHNVDFLREVRIENNNKEINRAYFAIDFVVPRRNLWIEFNGEQHYENVPHFYNHGWTFEQQQKRDAEVRKIARERGVKLVEIHYNDEKKIPRILYYHIFKAKTVK